MIFSERTSINLNLFLLAEFFSASPNIYICEELLKKPLMTAFLLVVFKKYTQSEKCRLSTSSTSVFHFWKITIIS